VQYLPYYRRRVYNTCVGGFPVKCPENRFRQTFRCRPTVQTLQQCRVPTAAAAEAAAAAVMNGSQCIIIIIIIII